MHSLLNAVISVYLKYDVLSNAYSFILHVGDVIAMHDRVVQFKKAYFYISVTDYGISIDFKFVQLQNVWL